MAVVEIREVTQARLNPARLWEAAVQAPTAGAASDVYSIKLAGWVLGRSSPAVAIEVIEGDTVVRTSPIGAPRPDVAARYPKVPEAATCGYWQLVGVVGLPTEFELRVRAVLADDGRVPLGVIRGRHEGIRSGYAPRLQPLMVTSLGRTGTTWMMRVISEHPEIVAHRRYPYELHAAKYWAHMLRVLTEPADHARSSHPERFQSNLLAIGYNPFNGGHWAQDPGLAEWFGRTYVENVAAFGMQSTDACYDRIAAGQNQANVRYFAEKYLVDYVPDLMWNLYPDAREVVLVRDLRDMVSSMLAFNAKRGFGSFGRERAASDEEFINQLRHGATRLLRSWQRRSARAHLLRYEDLVLHPHETLHALLTYLDLDASPSTIEGMMQRASQETPELRGHRTSESPAASIGRWQRDLDPAHKALCDEVFGDILREFGYATPAVVSVGHG